jgi:peptidoglycan/LPS O-acetylase OafA/YrhL
MSEMLLQRLGDASEAAAVADESSTLAVAAGADHPKYRPDIDGLRAIAILSVVTFHAAPGRLPSGFIGVDVFFVISGFLITSIIVGGLSHDRFSFIEFYVRRIKRILPALSLVLLSCLGAGFLFLTDDEAAGLGKHIAAGAGFVSNLTLWNESGYFDSSADFKPLLHLWSLGIEEQFYIFWPLLLWLASGRRAHYLALTVAIVLASFALNVYQTGSNPVAAFYSPLPRLWELLLGGGLAYWMATRGRFTASESWRNFGSLAGLTLLVVAFVGINKDSAFPGWRVGLPTLGTALFIWAGARAWVNRALLSTSVMVWFGRISFPLYLWHWPLLAFPRIIEGTEVVQWKRLFAVAIAMLLAWLTYEFVEKPVRHSARPRRTALILLSLMMAIGAVGAWTWAQDGFGSRRWAARVVNAGDIGERQFNAYVGAHYFPCTPLVLRIQADDGSGFLRCPQSMAKIEKDIAIVGDSHAESLFPGLADILPDKNIVFYGNGMGLPFLANPDYTGIFDYVLRDPSIKVVLIAAMWERKLKPLSIAEWRSELTRTVSSLTRAGKEVYLVDDVPKFSFLPMRCKFDGRLGLRNLCAEKDENFEATYFPVFKEIAAYLVSAHVVSVHGHFCKDGMCSMARDGSLLFRDEHHLTIAGSRLAAEAIVSQMQAP